MTGAENPICPDGPWWQRADIMSDPSNVAWNLVPYAILLVLVALFVAILVAGLRTGRLRRSLGYLSLQGGCGAAIVMWGFLVWVFSNLPSCL